MLLFRIRRMFRAIVWTSALVTAVLTGAYVLDGYRVDPSDFSDEYLHERGTTSAHADFSDRIGVRPVVIDSDDCGGVRRLFECAGRVMTRQHISGIQAEYDPEADEIRIIGEQVQYEATLPEPLRGGFYSVVRHEYGHAAFFDWLAAERVDPVVGNKILLAEPDTPPRREMVPESLHEVMGEWSRQSRMVYGDPYFMSNFAEYIAESYARVLGGRTVPPATREFLFAAYGGAERS